MCVLLVMQQQKQHMVLLEISDSPPHDFGRLPDPYVSWPHELWVDAGPDPDIRRVLASIRRRTAASPMQPDAGRLTTLQCVLATPSFRPSVSRLASPFTVFPAIFAATVPTVSRLPIPSSIPWISCILTKGRAYDEKFAC